MSFVLQVFWKVSIVYWLLNPWPLDSDSNWNLEMFLFRRVENQSTQRKTSWSKDKNQQQSNLGHIGGMWALSSLIPATQLTNKGLKLCVTLLILDTTNLVLFPLLSSYWSWWFCRSLEKLITVLVSQDQGELCWCFKIEKNKQRTIFPI